SSAQAFILRICTQEAPPSHQDETRLGRMLKDGEPTWSLWGAADHYPPGGRVPQIHAIDRDVLAERVQAARHLRAQGRIELNQHASGELLTSIRGLEQRIEPCLATWRELPPPGE